MGKNKAASNYRKLDKKTREKAFKGTRTAKLLENSVGTSKGKPRKVGTRVVKRYK